MPIVDQNARITASTEAAFDEFANLSLKPLLRFIAAECVTSMQQLPSGPGSNFPIVVAQAAIFRLWTLLFSCCSQTRIISSKPVVAAMFLPMQAVAPLCHQRLRSFPLVLMRVTLARALARARPSPITLNKLK